MLGACREAKLFVGQLSFARALTETRLFLKSLLATGKVSLWASILAAYVHCCSRFRVKFKPGRQFTRERQENRRKSRGLEKHRKGRKRKYEEAFP